MYDAMVFREAAAATGKGDVGRVWESLKVIFEVPQSGSGTHCKPKYGLHIHRLNSFKVHKLPS